MNPFSDNVIDQLADELMRRLTPMVAQLLTDRTATSGDRLLTAEEAAEKLRLKPQTLAKWRVTGDGPKYRRIGTRALYEKREVERWLEARTYAHTSEEGAS